jgi:hypothetical protein
MRRQHIHGIYTGLLLATVLVAVAPTARAGPVLISANVPAGQTLRQLIAGTFIEKVRCAEACSATTNIVITPQTAKRLQFPGVKANQPYAIALIVTELKAGEWTTIRLRAGSQARPLLAKSPVDVRIDGVIYGQSRADRSHRGATGWSAVVRR